MTIQAGHIISQIKRLSDRIFERILTKRNIDAFNGAQGRILYVLWQEESISLRDLSDRTGLAATTLTSMIDRMEAAGLVRRVPDQHDRRKTLLTLTEKARNLQQDYTAVSGQMADIFYAGFTEDEILLCESMLERIYENLKLNSSDLLGTRLHIATNERRNIMSQNAKDYVIEKVKELINAPSCCADAKEAAQNWLDALGTDKEAGQAKNLIAELEVDIMPIDSLIAFAESEAGAKVFGEENAKNVAAHGKEIKAAGAKYCDCAACAACEAILEKKDEIA